ncbi:phage head morphogenesis protein, partial [Salmonella enterica subsp. enterica serovar Agona]
LRHGKLYTTEEVREWYSINGNAINCKCTQVSVLVDEAGNPLYPNVIDMARKRLEKAKQAGLVPNHSHCGCGRKHAA